MKKELNLYNACHNGDVFYSRPLVSLLKSKYKINYYHNNQRGLFSDMTDEVNEYTPLLPRFNHHFKSIDHGDINTWIGLDRAKYLESSNIGCSFENYFNLIKDLADEYEINLDIENWNDILPKVQYEKLPNIDVVKKQMDYIRPRYKKIILWSNGNALSGQSENFDMAPLIHKAAKRNPNYLHLITSLISVEYKLDNILPTYAITNRHPDLLYLSYISTFCDTIIGRESGPYCFTNVVENINNENQKYICFANHQAGAKWFQERKNPFIWTNNYHPEHIWDTIKNNL